MSPGPTRIAIVGAGVIGTIHARLIADLPQGAQLVAVVDSDSQAGRALADAYGVPAYRDSRAAFATENVELASICTPSATHADCAIAALEAGCDVIVEKPIDITLAAADRLIAAEKASGRTVSVISQRRFQPSALAIKNAIVSGALGKVTAATVESAPFRAQSYYESGDWRGTLAIDGGGALMNQGIHMLDLLLWYLGDPVEISARWGKLAHEDIEVEDVVGATLVFASGAIATMLATTNAYPGVPTRIAVFGDAGSAVMDDEKLHFYETATGGQPEPAQDEATGAPADWPVIDIAHQGQYKDVLEAIRAGRKPGVTTTDGRRALEIVLAIYEAALTGRPVRPGRSTATSAAGSETSTVSTNANAGTGTSEEMSADHG